MFDVACNVRKLADMAWDIARSTAKLVGADVMPSITSRLVSGANVESPMIIH